MKQQEVIDKLYKKLSDYLASQGINPSEKFICIAHDHEETLPSCCLMPHNEELIHCFGCLDGDELIRTQNGIIPIKDAKIGSGIYDHEGTLKEIVAKESHKAEYPICEVKLHKFKTTNRFTENHTMLIVREELVDNMPYMVYEKNIEKHAFSMQQYDHKRSKKYAEHLKIEKIILGEVNPGDYMVFPCDVLEVDDDHVHTESIIREYTSGPKNDRITEIPLNEKTLYMMGMFVAEGNVYRGGINFSLHSKETEYARKIKEGILEITSNHDVIIDDRKDRENSLSVRCSSTDLEIIFEHHFGRGSENKRIPLWVKHLSDKLKRAFVDGLMDGDGNKDGVLDITSKEVILELEHILFALAQTFSYAEVEAYNSSDGISHKKRYRLRINTHYHNTFFYDFIDGKQYAFMKIESINKTNEFPIVYDITVDDTHTFLTEKYAVCNCNRSWNIFHVANELEGYPFTGSDFWKITVPELCKRFDIDYEPVELSEDDKKRLKQLAACKDAASIVCDYPDKESCSSPIYDYLEERKWEVETAVVLGIGAVPSFDEYMARMKYKNWDDVYLRSVGLADTGIFNENNLIFTVKDENGRPRGFAARDMKHVEGNGPKYKNSTTNEIYHKGELLYCFNTAKRNVEKNQPIWIVEGYADVPTLWEHGIKNVAAVGGTSFCEQHIELLNEHDMYNINFLFDNDNYQGTKKKGGQEALASIIDKYFKGSAIFNVRIKELPPNTDPDEFFIQQGREAFEQLPLLSPFEWSLRRVPYNIDSFKLAQDKLVDIAMEPSAIQRDRMLDILSSVVDISKKVLDIDLQRELKKKDSNRERDVRKWAEGAGWKLRDISRKHSTPEEVLAEIEGQWKNIKKKYDKHEDDESKYINKVKLTRKSFMTDNDPPFNMGPFNKWRDQSETIPKHSCFIVISAIANVGKSSLTRNLGWEIAKNNDDAVVIYFSLDDPFQKVLASFISMESHLPINTIKDAQRRVFNDDKKMKKWTKAWDKFEAMKDRFIIKDFTDGNDLAYVENTIKYYQKKFPGSTIIPVIDSFNKLTDYMSYEKESRATLISARCKQLATTYDIPLLAVIELRKTMTFTARPTVLDIKNTRAIEYDADIIIMMHQPLHVDPETEWYYWVDTEIGRIKQPIVEANFDKNKESGFKGRFYLKFGSDQSRFEECTAAEIEDIIEREQQKRSRRSQYPGP